MLEETTSPNMDFPNEEIKYQQSMEEMKQLVPYLKEEMKLCPTENLIFTLIETVDFYSLKRFFKLKSNSDSEHESLLARFKDTLLANISLLDSFVVIPQKNSLNFDTVKNKGNAFKSPLVYNIEGDEVYIDIENEEKILFIYNNVNDLNLFLEKNKTSEKNIICLGINPNFFEQKKLLKKNGFLNKNNFQFFFFNNENQHTELIMNNLPRLIKIEANNIISEDKSIKNNNFEIKKIIENKNEDTNKKMTNTGKKIGILFY